MMRVETGEVFVGEIPVLIFQGRLFKQKLYLDRAVEIVLKGLEELRVEVDEDIRVCTGYVLSRVRETLHNRGYKVIPSRIVGETQRAAEEAFVKSLVEVGIARDLPDAGKRRFTSLLRWVLEDLQNREKFVKTGWPAWERKLRRSGSIGTSS